MQTLLTLATILVAFIMSIICYERGLKNGYNLAKDKPIEQVRSPVETAINALESHKQKEEAAKTADELTEMLTYDYQAALDAVKKER
jgi:hypothetical protein